MDATQGTATDSGSPLINRKCVARDPRCVVHQNCADCLRAIRNPHPKRRGGMRQCVAPTEDDMAKPVLTKKQTTQKSEPQMEPPISVDLEARYPCLVAHMTQEVWEDKTPRLTTTVLFFMERGTLKLCLCDRDGGRSCFLAGDSFSSLLEAAEQGLEEDSLVWRARRNAGGRGIGRD